ncbi:MAG TPA: carbon-nitrogen hydrolase family protein [Bryobacteraceae bacterium]|nr:carbon-nitrogen hydrolase family protein [Bryobacteraceae bacterium]
MYLSSSIDHVLSSPKLGRPVCAVSIGFPPGRPLESILEIVGAEVPSNCDLVVLPETFLGQNESSAQSLDGPCIRAFAELALKHGTYIVCPIDRRHQDRRFNSAVLIDRAGRIAAVYDKIQPLWWTECQLEPPVVPGEDVVVCDTDFGRLGLSICFDINWPGHWRALAEAGAELVVWPSAYSGGRLLQAHAIQNHYYILTSTWWPDCRVYDIDGSVIGFEQRNRGDDLNVTTVTLDLDRRIFHYDRHQYFRASLARDFPGEIIEERHHDEEAWFILKAARPGVSVPEFAARHGLMELREYLDQATRELDRGRLSQEAVAFASAAAGTVRR